MSPDDDAIVTLINTFTCAEVRQEELVAALDKGIAEIFSQQRGYLSASVLASLDRTRVVNYAEWASMADFDALQARPDVQEYLAQIMTLVESADPRIFRNRISHRADSAG